MNGPKSGADALVGRFAYDKTLENGSNPLMEPR